MQRRWKAAAAAVVACVVVAGIAFVGRSNAPAPSASRAESPKTQLQNGRTGSPPSRGAAFISLDPFASIKSVDLIPKALFDPLAQPAEKLRALGSMSDPFEAQLLAVRSGDPLLVATALYMTMHCSDPAVMLHGRNVREWMTEQSFDPKTGTKVPPNEILVAMNEAAQQMGPRRMYPPPELRAELVARQRDWTPEQQPNYQYAVELTKKLTAPLTSTQKAAYDAQVERASMECRGRVIGGADFGAAYRAALDRLVADGVVSAQLFNRRAGWQSQSISELNDRDYELVERAIIESQPDGIARLLSPGNATVGSLNYAAIPNDAVDAALALGFTVSTLAACELGVSDCGPTSWRFRSACISYGGCDQPDLAALFRHVFQRDGLDPKIIDGEVGRVVAAYRARDLNALGIRRKPPPP